MVCSALCPAGVSADSHSWDSLTLQGHPVPPRTTLSPAPSSTSWRFSFRLPPTVGNPKVRGSRCASRGLLVGSTVAASFRFPVCWGSTPPGLLLVGLHRFPATGRHHPHRASPPERQRGYSTPHPPFAPHDSLAGRGNGLGWLHEGRAGLPHLQPTQWYESPRSF